MTKWKKTDPRHEDFDRATIIIVRPRAYYPDEVCMANVETKHAYYIHTTFAKPYHRIGEGDDWPEDWQWIYAPEAS